MQRDFNSLFYFSDQTNITQHGSHFTLNFQEMPLRVARHVTRCAQRRPVPMYAYMKQTCCHLTPQLDNKFVYVPNK